MLGTLLFSVANVISTAAIHSIFYSQDDCLNWLPFAFVFI